MLRFVALLSCVFILAFGFRGIIHKKLGDEDESKKDDKKVIDVDVNIDAINDKVDFDIKKKDPEQIGTGCTGEEGTLDETDQNLVDKLIQRCQGEKCGKLATLGIRRVLNDPDSRIRKLLGRLLQDPSQDDFDEGDVGTTSPIPRPLIKLLSKVVGETKTVIGYLWHYGFIPKVINKSPIAAENFNGTIPACAVTNAIKEFQSWNSLEPTGKLDKETRELMAKHRCGNPDVQCETEECLREEREAEEVDKTHDKYLRRRKRYAVRKETWKMLNHNKIVLTYYYSRYIDMDKAVADGREPLTPERIRAQVEEAFKTWTTEAPIALYETAEEQTADIKIGFYQDDHGDGYPFDGEGGILAHMFYPKNGKMHFDSAENYVDYISTEGKNLFYVAAHELGHGLGIKHSQAYGALMYPSYRVPRTDRGLLDGDDVKAIRSLYSKGEGCVQPLGRTQCDDLIAKEKAEKTEEGPGGLGQLPPDYNPTCVQQFSAGLIKPDGEYIYLFYGTKYVRLERASRSDQITRLPVISEGYPLVTAEHWPGLEGPFRAAVTDRVAGLSYFLTEEDRVFVWDWDEDKVQVEGGVPRGETPLKDLPDGVTAIGNYWNVFIVFTEDDYFLFTLEDGLLDPEGYPNPFKGQLPKTTPGLAFNSFFNGVMYTIPEEFPNDYYILRSRRLYSGGKGVEKMKDSRAAIYKYGSSIRNPVMDHWSTKTKYTVVGKKTKALADYRFCNE